MKLTISTEIPFSNTFQQTMPQSKAVTFSWKLESEIPNQAEVLVYRAIDIFDDRFYLIEQGQSVDNMLILQLALAQQWMYYFKEDGSIESVFCSAASMMKRALLKQGTYLYIFRINGELKVNNDDKVTRLATKREVNYIDVRENEEENSYQDVQYQHFCQPSSNSIGHTENVNNKTELFKAYAAVRDMYHVNMTMNRVSPLETAIWNRVEKEMVAKINLNRE